MRTPGNAQVLEARRRLAIDLLQRGHQQCEVAEMLGVAKGTVSRWNKAHGEGGDDALAAKPHPGKPPALADEHLPRLKEILLQGAVAAGYDNELWTLGRVAAVIRKEFGVRYSQSQVWHVLRDRMGWTAQKPQPRARERNPAKVRAWRSLQWARIKKKRPPRAASSSSSTRPA